MFLDFDLFTLVVRTIVLLTTIPVHEAAHAYVAYKLGDPTAKYSGRLTLNPMAHFDPVGTLRLLFTGIGWAKPVPINPLNFRESKKGMAISAAAGPISNLILATISLAAYKILFGFYVATGAYDSYILTTFMTIFSSMCYINVSLAIFNLMPFPPFDGSRIFNYFLSDKYYFKIMEYEQYIFYIVFALLIIGAFDMPLNFLSGIVMWVLDKITFIFGAPLTSLLRMIF